MALKHLRSSTANKRPQPSGMADGQLAMNTASGSPGLFLKDSSGNLVKVGPVHVGSGAPNVSPASGGASGNTVGEQWLDTSGGTYVFKIWDGTTWRSETGEFVNASGDTMTGSLTMGVNATIVFEGSVDDGFETTLTVTNPTADRTITLPNVTGTVITTGDSGTVTSTIIANDTIVNADINSAAAIAGTKISPNFGGQNIVTSGTFIHALASSGAPSITFSGDSDTGIFSPGANNIAISNGGVTRLAITDSGLVRLGEGSAEALPVGLASLVCVDGTSASPNASLAVVSRGGGGFGGQSNESIVFTSAAWSNSAFITHGTTAFGDNLTLAGADYIFVDAGVSGVLNGATSSELQSGGSQRLIAKTTELVINDTADNYDFRVEGDTNANLLFVDASTDCIGIGTSTPSNLVHIHDTIGTTSLRLSNNSVGPQNSNQIVFESQLFGKTATISHSANSSANTLQIGGVSDLYIDADRHIFRDISGLISLFISDNGQVAFGKLFAAGAPEFSFTGDPDTGIYSPGDDELAITASGVERAKWGANEVVFNDGGADYDFRVEGTAATNLLLADASANTVFINGSGLALGTSATIVFEGSVNDGFDTTLTVDNPTANRTIRLPNVSGTIITSGDTGTVTNTMLAGSIADSKLNTISTANKVSIAALDIDGGTDIGAALADADLFIVDDGGAGTNRKSAATRIPIYTFSKVSGDVTITSSGIASIEAGVITNTEISASAGIVDSKLATISTAGKVANSATTATSANTPSGIVARDGSGNFTAGTITASGFSGPGTSLTSLPAAQLTGTIPSAVLGNSSHFIGTTSVALNRTSANQGLTGISSLAMPGATAGTITLTPAASGGTTAITIPATAGTLVTTGDSGTVTSTMIANLTIVDGDINASAAIAGTKISPNFGGQTITSSGVFVHPSGTGLLPSVTFSGDLNSGLYSPSSDVVAITCSGKPGFGVNSWGQISNDPTFPALTYDVQFSLVGAFDAHAFGSFVAGMAVYSTLATSGVSSLASYVSAPSLQAAVGDVSHFLANNIGLDVGGSTVNQTGFYAPFGLTDQATYNYGFQSGIGVGSTATNYSIFTAEADTYLGSRNTIFAPNYIDVARITPSGLYIGTTTASRALANFVVARTDASTYGTFTSWNGASSQAGILALGKSRAATPDAIGVVVAGDELGSIEFRGDDGTSAQLRPAASIQGFADATVASGDIPGRVAVYTVPDGSTTLTERWRVTNDGVIARNQPAPTVKSAAATLTAAEMKTGIVQYTGAAATLTLPSGATLEASFNAMYNNMAFEWSVINTGTGTCTIGTNTGHTISGATTVASGTSGRYLTRRVSANTFVNYRLS